MKLQLLTAVAVTALMAVPSLASAEDQGWYVRGNVGYGVFQDTELRGAILGDVEGEADLAASAGVGYAFGNNWRLELDGSQLFNDMGAIAQSPGTSAKLRTTTGMLNAIYDFNTEGKVSPYLGAGIGFARTSLSASAHDFLAHPTAGPNLDNTQCVGSHDFCHTNDNDSGFAWQLLAGIGYDITDRLVWDTHYKYQNVGDQKFDVTTPSVAGLTTRSEGNIGSHAIMTGLRYKFGASAPKVMHTCWDGSSVEDMSTCPTQPVAKEYISCWDGSQVEVGVGVCPAEPVPTITCWDNSVVENAASCPAQPTITCWDNSVVSNAAFCPAQPVSICDSEYQQEIIYYEFDKPQSAETQAKIQRILDVSQQCNVGNINVVGHTDSSGAASYNLALSKRRAADVRKELVRQGIPGAVITSEGKGETQLFIDTGDNVKEMLNRRTEVLIRLNR